LGRNYIGIEIDEKYIKIAQKNIEETIETKINGKYVSIYLDNIRTMRDKDFCQIWGDSDNYLIRNRNINLSSNNIFKHVNI
jgi:hypothetical protein